MPFFIAPFAVIGCGIGSQNHIGAQIDAVLVGEIIAVYVPEKGEKSPYLGGLHISAFLEPVPE